MYEANGNTKITLVVHSMGGPVSLFFLTKVVDQQWKDTYIHSYITLAGVWAGNSNGIRSLLSGPPSNPFVKIDFKSLYRTMPSFYYLLPHAPVWKKSVLVTTPTQTYTATDYSQLFSDAGYPQGYTQLSEISLEQLAPNVSTYCFYGLGHPTPLRFVYDKGFPNTTPEVINGDGDNTVNKKSSEICLQWASSGYPFKRTIFHDTDHLGIVSDESVLQTIASIVGSSYQLF